MKSEADGGETAGSMPDDSWWKAGPVYEVYPRSFQDSNGDGIGDIAGIRSRLDHLVGLGVQAIWICPIYPSPMADFGYDVTDYCDIDARFGTLEDFDGLVDDAHRRGLRVILDFVPNHTSDRHPWFVESRSARNSPRRDWYLWRDPAQDGGPPNNWLSNFGGSAWTFDPSTGQYFYHAFLKEQPDLNWRNPAVRTAMYEVLRFWLRRGVDGFRVDVLDNLIKDDQFRDNPISSQPTSKEASSTRLEPLYTTDRPELAPIIVEMRRVLEEFECHGSTPILIGEIHLPLARMMAYYGLSTSGRLDGVHLPFNFQLVNAPWTAQEIKRIIGAYEAALPANAWPNWVLGNHDESRIASRVGPRQARVAAMLLMTLRGTPTMYYGDEIGMTDVFIPRDEIQDPAELNDPGKDLGRDPQRTPMPWSAAPNAGFTTGIPWLRLGPDWRDKNVASLEQDPCSLLELYRQLIALRARYPALRDGTCELIESTSHVLAYARAVGTQRLTVLLNFSGEAASVAPGAVPPDAVVQLSTHLDRSEVIGHSVMLRPDEGLVLA